MHSPGHAPEHTSAQWSHASQCAVDEGAPSLAAAARPPSWDAARGLDTRGVMTVCQSASGSIVMPFRSPCASKDMSIADASLLLPAVGRGATPPKYTTGGRGHSESRLTTRAATNQHRAAGVRALLPHHPCLPTPACLALQHIADIPPTADASSSFSSPALRRGVSGTPAASRSQAGLESLGVWRND